MYGLSNGMIALSEDEGHFFCLNLCNTCNTHTHNRFTALWNLSGTTRVSRYQKKHL